MHRILIVDDDAEMAGMTKEYLEAKGNEVTALQSPLQAIELLKEASFDLCILDVKMPEIDGFALAEKIRELDEFIPFIFLSGQSLKEDRIKGLQLGADDYIVKPFSMEELQLRISAIMKRYKVSVSEKKHYQLGSYTFEPDYQELNYTLKKIKLTAIETKLLKLLLDNLNQTISREDTLKTIWGDDDYYKGKSLNVYITRLRKYFTEDKNIEIMNVHSEGYKLMYRE